MILVLMLPLLSGCWDRLDPENMAFVIAIGIDPGPSNDYLFTFALALPKPVSGASGGGGQSSDGGQKKVISVYTVEGSNIASALLASQSFIARRLTLIHSKVFIFGEEMARKGVMPILSEVVRNRQFRRSMHVMTTKGEASTYIQNILPTTESDISLWFELQVDPNNMGALLPKSSRFHDFIMDIETPGTGSVTIQTAPRPDIREGTVHMPAGNTESDAAQPNIGEKYAGSLPRSGEVPVEFFGSAVYKSSVLAGYLNGSETRILNMLRGEFTRMVWSLNDPSDSKRNLSFFMNAKNPTVMDVKRKNDRVLVTFRVAMEGELVSVQSNVDYTQPENTKKLEQSIEKQLHEQSAALLDKMLHNWQTDCFLIHNQIKSTFSTFQEWEAFKWGDHVKDTDYELDISFKMRRHGDQVGPAVEGDKMQ